MPVKAAPTKSTYGTHLRFHSKIGSFTVPERKVTMTHSNPPLPRADKEHDKLSGHTQRDPDDHVMAWSRDRDTGEPRYILELDEHHRGAHCNCVCAACGASLIAVNAARKTFQVRPHFRHSNGSEKHACLLSAARVAFLTSLLGDGYLDLPGRRRFARIQGLSGHFHDAWVDTPPERVHISAWTFADVAEAVLSLDGGRELRVLLVGRAYTDDGSGWVPGTAAIEMVVDDVAIASMGPEELRSRIRLVTDGARWCRHWRDDGLLVTATEQARANATDALDWLPGRESLPVGVNGPSVRETLLHRKAKEILAREKRLMVPALTREDHPPQLVGQTPTNPGRTSRMLELAAVTLEQPFGRIRPDVCATTLPAPGWPAEMLHIEITVTHHVDPQRLARIFEADYPTLEIDLSRLGGKVTEAEFERLIVEELAAKKWLHHPALDEERRKLKMRREEPAAALRGARLTRRSPADRYPAPAPGTIGSARPSKPNQDGWLSGPELEQWRKAHPDRAAELDALGVGPKNENG